MSHDCTAPTGPEGHPSSPRDEQGAAAGNSWARARASRDAFTKAKFVAENALRLCASLREDKEAAEQRNVDLLSVIERKNFVERELREKIALLEEAALATRNEQRADAVAASIVLDTLVEATSRVIDDAATDASDDARGAIQELRASLAAAIPATLGNERSLQLLAAVAQTARELIETRADGLLGEEDHDVLRARACTALRTATV